MDSTYLYSGTYASVLSSRLLSETQRELLLASSTPAEMHTVLLDTPLAAYVTEHPDIKIATQAFVAAEVTKLRRLIPDEVVLAILLLRHDYYNAKQIVLAKQAGQSDEATVARCRPLGTISPARLLTLVNTNTLRFTYPELGELYRTIAEANPLPHDIVDVALLTHLVSLADQYPNSFVSRYVTLTIDLHNLLMRLRVLTHPESDALLLTGTFVPGGSMSKTGLESLESVLSRLGRFGGEAHWREAKEAFEINRDFSQLDRAADNYLMRFLKRESIEVHSPAPLFAYYHAVLEHTQFIAAIASAHAAGLQNSSLRHLVRNSLLSYAY